MDVRDADNRKLTQKLRRPFGIAGIVCQYMLGNEWSSFLYFYNLQSIEIVTLKKKIKFLELLYKCGS